jgi:hypothetical protein
MRQRGLSQRTFRLNQKRRLKKTPRIAVRALGRGSKSGETSLPGYGRRCVSTTALDRGTSAAVSHEAQPDVTREAVDRIVHIYRDFLTEVRGIVSGISRPLVKTDEDCEGADFAFCIRGSSG